MLYSLPKIMIECLIITILVELLMAYLLRIKNKKDLLNCLLANILTNPVVSSMPYLISLLYGYKAYIISLILLELWAVIIEGLVYKKYLNYKKINPFIISIILNLSSYIAGVIIYK